jgi:hypothetical protein
VHVQTALSSVVENHSDTDATEFTKRIPALSVNPVYNPEGMIGDVPKFNLRWTNGQPIPDYMMHKLPKAFHHEDTFRTIYYQSERVKIDFEVTIRVESLVRSWDIAAFLRNTFAPDRFFYLNREPIFAEIPNTLIRALAQDVQVDMEDPAQVEDFAQYLTKFSDRNITHRYNSSNGNTIFGYEHLVNLLMKVEGLPQVEKGEQNKSVDKSTVKLTMTCELAYPTAFIIHTAKPLSPEDGDVDGIFDEGNSVYINISMKSRPPAHFGDKSLVFFKGFVSDINVKTDSINLWKFIEPMIQYIIEDNTLNGVDNDTVFKTVLWKGNDELPEDEYQFNWEDGELVLLEPFFNSTYHFGLYIDKRVVHEFEESVTRLGDDIEVNDISEV